MMGRFVINDQQWCNSITCFLTNQIFTLRENLEIEIINYNRYLSCPGLYLANSIDNPSACTIYLFLFSNLRPVVLQ